MPDMVPFGIEVSAQRKPPAEADRDLCGDASCLQQGRWNDSPSRYSITPPIYSEVDRATNQLCSYSAVSQP